MEHPKDVGDRSTLAVILALRQAGFHVLVPFGENTRYELVIDDGTQLARVQCKTGRLRSGAVLFKAASSYAHHPHPRMRSRNYIGQIDVFAVYCPDNGAVYLVPIQDASLAWQGSLRVAPPRNSQRRRIRYEIGRVVVSAIAGPGASAGAG
jgi:hypothetical protein